MPLEKINCMGLILFLRVEIIFYNRMRRLSIVLGIEEVSYYRFVLNDLCLANLVTSFGCELVIVFIACVKV
jgi:hypothetical protein